RTQCSPETRSGHGLARVAKHGSERLRIRSTPTSLRRGNLQAVLRFGPEPAEFVDELRRPGRKSRPAEVPSRNTYPRAPAGGRLRKSPQNGSHMTTPGR